VSTRAIVTIVDGKDTQRIYAHGDGYPAGVGQLVKYFAAIAPGIDMNSEFKKRIPNQKWSPYAHVANVSTHTNKFTAGLLGYLWQKGYTGAYLTDRNPLTEEPTDIDWHYIVTLPGDYGSSVKPKLQVYRGEDKGFKELPDVEWESYDGKTPYWVERKQHEAAEKKRKATGLKVPAVKPRAKKLRVINTGTGALLYGLKRSRR
jgi:hypothetical protein